jgi:hypothetical protein
MEEELQYLSTYQYSYMAMYFAEENSLFFPTPINIVSDASRCWGRYRKTVQRPYIQSLLNL